MLSNLNFEKERFAESVTLTGVAQCFTFPWSVFSTAPMNANQDGKVLGKS